MPDQPDSKRRPVSPVPGAVPASCGYAELHCKTNFSFLEGASHPDELVNQAAQYGYAALAITDRNSLAGIVRAHIAAKEANLKLLIGVEITPIDAPPLVVLAPDRAAYGRLARLISLGRRNAPKGECRLSFDDVAAHADGLLAGVIGNAPAIALNRYRDTFADRCYLFAERHLGANDNRALAQRIALAKEARLPLVAANDVHFHHPARKPLADVLTAIRHGRTVQTAGDLLFPNASRHLKPLEELRSLFSQTPDAIERSAEIADRCHFSLDELRYEYPEELAPAGLTPLEHLTQLTWDGARARYPAGIPVKVRQLIEHELQLIAELQYEAFFLTVYDLVRFARSRNILCQGRGSAANSAVCYCLGVTSVDPEQMDVLFERFISRERNEAPDIDVDFEHERREEVIQYVYEKYGRDRAGMTAEVITYRPRSAVRDVGKALGLSLDRLDALAKTLDRHNTLPEERCIAAGIDSRSGIGKQFVTLVGELLGFPRHLGQHVGGMVVTHGPLCELVPIENAAMDGRTIIEWDKDDLDELGILKVDCLALGMLTAIHKCFDYIDHQHGRPLTLADVPAEDSEVYDMICRADTMGVFQIESRAQMSMLPRLRPRTFYDLVIEVAIVRPGPIQGDMVHPYLRRRMTGEQIDYPSDAIKKVLHKTLGVPLFQEQAMRLAMVAAGFSPGEADQLRRAMAAWRRPGVIDVFRTRLLQGMQANGLSKEFAETVFTQIRGFGEYGFPESHAASFARLAYVSAWLKFHYPAAFCAALLNSQPMGFYAPAQLVRDAQEHGIEVWPVDVNHSCWDCTLEGSAVRLGLRMIVGLPESQAKLIENARDFGPYRSMDDFHRRSGVSSTVCERLAKADAFGSLHMDRRTSLWQALRPAADKVKILLLFGQDDDEPAVALPAMDRQQEVFADYRTAGLSLKAHPVSFFRLELEKLGVVPTAELAHIQDGRFVRAAGLVLVRQRPGTANGITFVTIEDETGVANLIVRMDVWERFYHVARTAAAFIASGRLQNQQGVIHILVSRLENVSETLGTLRSRSRDFQ
jgi:error-prone DNA polymerase